MLSFFGLGGGNNANNNNENKNGNNGNEANWIEGGSGSGSSQGKKSLAVVNYMEGISYQPINPLMRFRMVAASFIRGEAKQYYRRSGDDKVDSVDKLRQRQNNCGFDIFDMISEHLLYPDEYYGMTSIQMFDECLRNALEYDFEGTIRFAVELRKNYFMRKNPQCIMMEAVCHPERVKFNETHPKIFKECLKGVIGRPDDMTEQLKYWVGRYGNKNQLPTCVKKVWAKELVSMNTYQLQKYKRFIPDLVRVSHAKGDINKNLNDIIQNGKTVIDDKQNTWERLRSSGMRWNNILETLEWRMPHMAALRNLIPFAREVRNIELIERYGEMLVAGVEGGKQYPFRYITAYREAKRGLNTGRRAGAKKKQHVSGANWHPKRLRVVDRQLVIDILERCLQESMKNYPKLDGDTFSLCDNSGSAHGTFTSTYGSVKVADIANLSALFTAYNTLGRGVVGVFGDRLKLYEVNKERRILEQYDEISELGQTVGSGTENGIWIAFRDSFEPENRTKMRFDNIFIYSDMQAGHGGLYGMKPSEYQQYAVELPRPVRGDGIARYIDVLKLVKDYRRKVNARVNVFSVQVAGYDNNLLPENIYRGAIMAGWTGNEVAYAKEMISIWNELDVK